MTGSDLTNPLTDQPPSFSLRLEIWRGISNDSKLLVLISIFLIWSEMYIMWGRSSKPSNTNRKNYFKPLLKKFTLNVFSLFALSSSLNYFFPFFSLSFSHSLRLFKHSRISPPSDPWPLRHKRNKKWRRTLQFRLCTHHYCAHAWLGGGKT